MMTDIQPKPSKEAVESAFASINTFGVDRWHIEKALRIAYAIDFAPRDVPCPRCNPMGYSSKTGEIITPNPQELAPAGREPEIDEDWYVRHKLDPPQTAWIIRWHRFSKESGLTPIAPVISPALVSAMIEALALSQKSIRELRYQGAPCAYWDDVEEKNNAVLARAKAAGLIKDNTQ
jgi:hypothetical protein